VLLVSFIKSGKPFIYIYKNFGLPKLASILVIVDIKKNVKKIVFILSFKIVKIDLKIEIFNY